MLAEIESKPRLVLVNPVITTDQSLRFYNAQMIAMKKGLDKYFDVTIVTRKESSLSRIRGPLLNKGIISLDFIQIPILNSIVRSIGTYLINLEQILSHINPKIVICTEDFSLTTYRVINFCKERNIPSIVWQGPYYYFGIDFGISHRIFSKTLGKRVYTNGSRFVAKSKRAANFLYRQGVETGKLSVISPCIDFNLFRRSEQVTNSISRLFPTGKRTFLYVGQLIEGKKVNHIIKAYNRILKDYDDIHLLIVTQGGREVKRISNLISELNLKANISFAYNMPNTYMAPIYSKAFATISSTRDTEIFGMNILESLACGTPVISTPHAGAQEMIIDGINGIIVDGFTEDDLEHGIRKLLDNPDMEKNLRDNSRSSVEGRFNIDHVALQWQKLANSLIAG